MSIPALQPSDGFEWTQATWGHVLRCRALAPFADHFFTDASLELRDDPRQWDAVAALAGVATPQLRRLRQVHGRTIAVAGGASTAWGPAEADGVITADRSVALVVQVADCASILIGDRRRRAAAAVHAGWRSTMQSIAPAAVAALQHDFRIDPADLVVAIGPSLGACCGEMGEEVVAAFRTAGHDDDAIERWFIHRPGRRPHFDLWRANREQLEAAGVPPASIHVAGLCTRTHPAQFHSYRARGPGVGRMAAVIRPSNR